MTVTVLTVHFTIQVLFCNACSFTKQNLSWAADIDKWEQRTISVCWPRKWQEHFLITEEIKPTRCHTFETSVPYCEGLWLFVDFFLFSHHCKLCTCGCPEPLKHTLFYLDEMNWTDPGFQAFNSPGSCHDIKRQWFLCTEGQRFTFQLHKS